MLAGRLGTTLGLFAALVLSGRQTGMARHWPCRRAPPLLPDATRARLRHRAATSVPWVRHTPWAPRTPSASGRPTRKPLRRATVDLAPDSLSARSCWRRRDQPCLLRWRCSLLRSGCVVSQQSRRVEAALVRPSLQYHANRLRIPTKHDFCGCTRCQCQNKIGASVLAGKRRRSVAASQTLGWIKGSPTVRGQTSFNPSRLVSALASYWPLSTTVWCNASRTLTPKSSPFPRHPFPSSRNRAFIIRADFPPSHDLPILSFLTYHASKNVCPSPRFLPLSSVRHLDRRPSRTPMQEAGSHQRRQQWQHPQQHAARADIGMY